MFFISACQEKLLLEDVFIQALRKKIFPANTEFKICLFMPLPDSSISLRPSIFTFINVLSNSYTHLSVRPVWMSLDSQSSVCALSTTTIPPSLFVCFSLVYPHAHHLAADLCYLSLSVVYHHVRCLFTSDWSIGSLIEHPFIKQASAAWIGLLTLMFHFIK